MNSRIVLLIVGMTLVTYIPRAIPAVFIDRMHFGNRMQKFLKMIPYTAMASLIVPGVFSTDPGNVLIGIIGGITAGILAWKKLPVMVCVLGAIAAVFITYAVI